MVRVQSRVVVMKKFFACERGNFAAIFAIASVPIFGAVGAAVDYTRATHVRSFMQEQADAAALAMAHDGSTGDPSLYLEQARAAISDRYGDGNWISGLEVDSEWMSQTDLRVSVTGKVPVTILAAVPGFPKNVKVSALSAIHVEEPALVYGPPTVTQLDPQASDYNRISVYCFNPKKKRDRKTHGRTQMTDIADNAGSSFKGYEMPSCAAGEALSYRLYNARDARSDRGRWYAKSTEKYEYFTDTEIKAGIETYDLDNLDILETVLCNKASDCEPKSKGGILPEGTNRTPERAKARCSPGKYMYYGWEDRPPGRGWTDQDYDDIRIVIGCPTVQEVGDRVVRLTR